MLNSLGSAFGAAYTIIRSLLQGHGYQVDAGYAATIDRLKIADNPGFFFINCHGGLAYMDEGPGVPVQRYCLSTDDPYSPSREADVAREGLIKGGMVSVADVVYDSRWLVLPVEKRVFMISEAFMKKYWRFSKNSLVVISACSSTKLTSVLARADVHASLACLWDNPSSVAGDKAVLFAVDRLLGANDSAVQPEEAGWPQRPFDYKSIERDMTTRKKNISHQFKIEGRNVTATLKFCPGVDNFGLLAPTIKNVSPVPYQRKLELIGTFGEDPGPRDRKVTINNIAMVVDKWKPDKITVLLPNQPVHGEVKVIHQGRESNSRFLSNWVGMVNIFAQGEGSLTLKAEFGVNMIGDPWSYRENAGDKPIEPMIWNLFSPIGSTCTWKAEGASQMYEHAMPSGHAQDCGALTIARPIASTGPTEAANYKIGAALDSN